MDRLTARSPKNNMAYLVKVKKNEQDVESPHPDTLRYIIESFERLAEYEDAGLSPNDIKVLQQALDKSCEDAADGCCPYDSTGEYKCERCESCSNRLGDREDMGRDAECWKNYYLQEARKINS